MAASVLEPLTVSVEEAAAMLGVSPTSIYERLRAGEFPGFRVGGRWVISRAQLQEWLEWSCRQNWRKEQD